MNSKTVFFALWCFSRNGKGTNCKSPLSNSCVAKSDEFSSDAHGWIIHLYWPDEVRELKKLGELPLDLEVVEKVENDKTGLEIAFNKD